MPTVTMAWLRKTPTISGTMTNTPATAAKNPIPARPARTDPLAEPPVRFRTVTAATPIASSPITSARISSPPEAGSPTRPWTARKPDNPSEASPRPKARFSWVLGGSAPPSPPPIRRSPARRWKMAARWVARYDTTAPTRHERLAVRRIQKTQGRAGHREEHGHPHLEQGPHGRLLSEREDVAQDDRRQ